ncbi:MAG: SCO1664 family protein [Actinomycetota bacterium]
MLRKPEELLIGEIEIEGRLVDASNATLYGKIHASDAREFSVVYKPIAGERPLWDFPNGNLAQREVASYILSAAGEFNCVPTTVLREGPFGLGAVQQWVDVNEAIDIIELGQGDLPSIRNIALFDVIVNNTDRKFGHLLPISESEVYGCDHGVTFHEEFKLRTVIWQFAGQELSASERNQIQLVQNFVERDQSFHSLLTAKEIAATVERIEKLKNEGFPVPTEEWPAIPWPPV